VGSRAVAGLVATRRVVAGRVASGMIGSSALSVALTAGDGAVAVAASWRRPRSPRLARKGPVRRFGTLKPRPTTDRTPKVLAARPGG